MKILLIICLMLSMCVGAYSQMTAKYSKTKRTITIVEDIDIDYELKVVAAQIKDLDAQRLLLLAKQTKLNNANK